MKNRIIYLLAIFAVFSNIHLARASKTLDQEMSPALSRALASCGELENVDCSVSNNSDLLDTEWVDDGSLADQPINHDKSVKLQ